MRRTTFAAAICTAGLVAGCGSSSTKTVVKTPVAPPGSTAPGSTTSSPGSTTASGPTGTSNPSGMTVGTHGTMGPPSGGSPYDLHNHTVLKHLLQGILNALAKKGDQNVEGACKAFTSTQAECEVRGINTQGQHFANLFTLTVNLSNGNFTVTNVKAVH